MNKYNNNLLDSYIESNHDTYHEWLKAQPTSVEVLVELVKVEQAQRWVYEWMKNS